MLNVRIGDKFQLHDGHFAELILADSHKVVLEDVNDKTSALPFSMDDFSKALERDDITPVIAVKPKPELTEFQVKARDERLKYILTLSELVHEQGLKPTSKETYLKLIVEVEKRYPQTQCSSLTPNKKIHPGHSTIARYWKMWVQDDYDNNALAPKQRNCPTRFDHHSNVFMNNFISNTYVPGVSAKGNYTAYKNAVDNANDDSLYLASERTFRRRVGELRAFAMRYSNASPAERNQLTLTYTQKYRQQYALERVEVDRCSLNLCLIDDDTGKPTKKVSLLIAIDCFTRYPLAVVVELGEDENKENVSNLFQHMFLNDRRLPAIGKPVNIIADNGPGFNNAAIHAITERLGTTLKFAPALKPQMKPFVESFINTLRKRFFDGWVMLDNDGKYHVKAPGYFKKRQANSFSINLKKEAKLTVSQFKAQLHQFLVEYVNDKHSQTKQRPIDMWDTSLKVHHQAKYQKLLDYDDVAHAFHVFSKQSTNKLQPRGLVNVHNQIFGSHELKQLYIDIHLNKAKSETPKVIVRYNPFDARYVSVTATIPGTQIAREVTVPNINLDIMPTRTSFDELSGLKPKSFGIYGSSDREPTGEFLGHIDRLRKPRGVSNSKRSGKRPASFEQNNQQKLSAEARAIQSNKSESKLDAEVEPVTPITRLEDDEKKKQTNAKTPSKSKNSKTRAKRRERGRPLW